MNAADESSHPRAPCRYCGELHPGDFSHCPKTGRPLNAGRALVGRTIAGRYRVLGLIGEGGMGAVYVAEHLTIGRKVALKRLHTELAQDEKAVARFQREARAAAATGHEHIVEVLDLGFAEDGAPFLAMEYVRGRSLAEVLRSEGALEPRRAARILGQVLAALAAVHDRGIVHRDLKPDNVLLTARHADPEFVKVVDFGISKFQKEEGDAAMALTRTGVMLGTPFYMSPEQARGAKDLDHRVDLYGAGVILYECLTGKLPFDGENYHQLLQQILAGKYRPARERSPAVSAELSGLVDRAIHHDPKQRFPSARALLLALVPHGAADPGPFTASARAEPGGLPLAETFAWSRDAALQSEQPIASDTMRPTDGRIARDSTPARPSAPPKPREARTPRGAPKGIAPEPGPLHPSPRRFLAQSVDWREEPPRQTREPPRRAPTPGAESRINLETPTRLKGAFMLAAVEHLKHRPGALERVLARLPPALSGQLSGVVLPMAWFPLTDYVELLRAAERELGGGDGALSVRLGRLTADRELTTTHRLFMQTATPALVIERIPHIFRTYHQPGRARTQTHGSGGYRVDVDALNPDTLPHALVLSGFYHRLLELSGAQDVRTGVVACRERGDDVTATTLRWR